MSDLVADLWPQALQEVHRRCAHTLRRLAHRGLYDSDDFLQDAWLHWHTLAIDASDPDGLMETWERHLYKGGFRLYRRTPQRIGHRRDYAEDPLQLELDIDLDTTRPTPAGSTMLLMATTAAIEFRYSYRPSIPTIVEALRRLNALDRWIIYLCGFLERTGSEAAAEMEISRNTAYSRLYRARRRMKEALDDQH